MKPKLSQLPWFIIIIGIFFSLYLVLQIPEGVFFSGDAGLKALLAKQLSTGELRFDLATPNIPWIKQLWEDGLYPFSEPFVYHFNEAYYITFPYTFPLVTAPFYAWFGFRGLYLIPLVATWLLWLIFNWVCVQLKLNPVASAIALLTLIFASPITLYSAMYWEHTLALVLAFSGMILILLPSSHNQHSPKTLIKVISSGCLIGLSVWFRPEFLCFSLIILSIVYIIAIFQLPFLQAFNQKLNFNKIAYLSENRIIFTLSIVITIGLFFVSNKLIYGHPLGIHAIQIVEQTSLKDRLKDALLNFQGLGTALFVYLPLTFLLFAYLILAFLPKINLQLSLKPITIYVLSLSLLFTIGVSLIVPAGSAGLIPGGKQWGPRFLLILFPLIIVLAIQQLFDLLQHNHKILKYSYALIFGILLILSIHKNSYAGTSFFIKNNDNIAPAINFLQQDSHQLVAVSHQFVVQALEPGLNVEDKTFFLVETTEQLIKLATAAINNNYDRFLYICYPNRACPIPETYAKDLIFKEDKEEYWLQLSLLDKFGKYPIYEVTIGNSSER